MEMARMASKKGGRKSWELVQSLSGKSFHPSEGGRSTFLLIPGKVYNQINTRERGHVQVVKSMIMKKKND